MLRCRRTDARKAAAVTRPDLPGGPATARIKGVQSLSAEAKRVGGRTRSGKTHKKAESGEPDAISAQGSHRSFDMLTFAMQLACGQLTKSRSPSGLGRGPNHFSGRFASTGRPHTNRQTPAREKTHAPESTLSARWSARDRRGSIPNAWSDRPGELASQPRLLAA